MQIRAPAILHAAAGRATYRFCALLRIPDCEIQFLPSNSSMKHSSIMLVTIGKANGQAELSRAQKAFNRLSSAIDRERRRLQAWKDAIPQYQEEAAKELGPLVDTLDDLRADLVRLFDHAAAESTFNKSDKAKLSHIICTIAEGLLVGNRNVDLKEIYNRHSGRDFDAEEEQEKIAMMSIMRQMLDIDIDEGITSAPLKTSSRMRAKRWSGNSLGRNKARKRIRDNAASARNHQERSPRRQGKRRKRKTPANPSGKSIGNWPVPCIPTRSRIWRSESARPR
jgi:hypothetical protein